MRASLFKGAAIIQTVLQLGASAADYSSQPCRYLPSDKGWPSLEQWQTLNTSVSGHLLKPLPAAHVCHDPTHDEKACSFLKENWIYPSTHFNNPSGFGAPYQQNASCSPYTPRESPCLQGNYVEYAIEVHEIADVVAGVQFAQENNVRLVIKNTGHDYLGKSTGKGALSLWMHNLKNIEILNYTSDTYTGPAMKMGAGVQAFEAFAAAHERDLTVLGGQCITVGISGGYTQGGGHSTLSGKHGIGADQALEWEVVTANGTLVKASTTQNTDLYWALSGGGGGTYGVVVSLTVRAHPDGVVGGLTFGFETPSGSLNDDALWDAVAFFQIKALPGIADAGAHVQWSVWGGVFSIGEATIPGASIDDMHAIFRPFTDYLTSQGIVYSMNVTSLPNFYEHADLYLGPFPHGRIWSNQIQGGAFISRETSASTTDGPKLLDILRHIGTNTSFAVVGYSFNGSVKYPSIPPNAVHPGWRDMLTYFLIVQPWNYTAPIADMREQERLISDEVMPPLQDIAIGAYMNEADFRNPRWKEDYYGPNWDRLSEIKRKWDPKGLLYAVTAVGSESWALDGEGRLCRVEE